MSVATVQLFYAILALVAIAAIAVVVVLRLVGLVSDGARDNFEGIARAVYPNALGLAWVVAVLATGGSLYFSEVADFEPCRLCWYQRIAMYPIVAILVVGAFRRDRAAAVYAGTLAAIGALISAYHVALEWIPALDSGACDVGTPCTLIWFREFGFISLPTLALVAFGLILTILLLRPSEGAIDRSSE
jgi:disulfide bond formation protein DsbB